MSQMVFTVSVGGTPVMPLLEALDEAVYAAGRNILQLGGYMIFFNLLNLLPGIFLPDGRVCAPLLEISGGLSILGDRWPLYTLLLLPAGGLCCLAQTGSCIRNTGLSGMVPVAPGHISALSLPSAFPVPALLDLIQ